LGKIERTRRANYREKGGKRKKEEDEKKRTEKQLAKAKASKLRHPIPTIHAWIQASQSETNKTLRKKLISIRNPKE